MNDLLHKFVEDGFCELGNITKASSGSNERSKDILRMPQPHN